MYIYVYIFYKSSVIYLFFFGHAHSIQKFPVQGSNLCHSNHPSCCIDNARSLTHCATRELLILKVIYLFICLFAFLGWHLQHMEVPRLGLQSEL